MTATTDLIQAGGSIVQSLCAVGALWGLYLYTRETKMIRKATLLQTEGAIRPYFDLHVDGKQAMTVRYGTIYITNVGEGHALNVRVCSSGFGRDAFDRRDRVAVSKGKSLVIADDDYSEVLSLIQSGAGLRVEYTDVSGKPYYSQFLPVNTSNFDVVFNEFRTYTGELTPSEVQCIDPPPICSQ